jgi:hypothetical protein
VEGGREESILCTPGGAPLRTLLSSQTQLLQLRGGTRMPQGIRVSHTACSSTHMESFLPVTSSARLCFQWEYPRPEASRGPQHRACSPSGGEL